MKSISTTTLLLLTIASSCLAGIYRTTVTEVIDGDTIKATIQGKEQTIQLAHIDCPELSQPYGQQAADYVREKIEGKEVGIKTVGKNIARETTAEVILMKGGKNLNYLLVTEGLAWPAKENKAKPIDAIAERAKKQKNGLWQQDKPVPPWAVSPEKEHPILKFSGVLQAGRQQPAERSFEYQGRPIPSSYDIKATATQRDERVSVSGRVSGPECDSLRIEVFGVSDQGDRLHVTDRVSIGRGVKSAVFDGEDTNYFWDKSRSTPSWQITSSHAFCD